MRITFLGHACHLVEVDGLRVLTDPWLTDPAFEGLVEHDVPLRIGAGDLPAVDVIALTHGHLDHFNAPTLASLPSKDVPVVHPPVRFTELDANLRRIGFTNLFPRPDFEPFEIGSVRIVPTPSRGVLDECAYLIEGKSGRFWNGADAPQPPEVVDEIASRFSPIDVVSCSHNSFDQPALLGLPSVKEADHGPEGAVRTATRLGASAAIPAASNLRWCGPGGGVTTEKVIRRSRADFLRRLSLKAPHVEGLDLQPGDAWSREGGIERGVLRGTGVARVAHDYIHPFLDTGLRWCDGEASSERLFRLCLPARLADAPEASRYVDCSVVFEVTGDDATLYSVDFRRPGEPPNPGDDGSPYAVRLCDRDWKALFARALSWQVLLMSDRLRVIRYRPGSPPAGLHFVYALQAVFP